MKKIFIPHCLLAALFFGWATPAQASESAQVLLTGLLATQMLASSRIGIKDIAKTTENVEKAHDKYKTFLLFGDEFRLQNGDRNYYQTMRQLQDKIFLEEKTHKELLEATTKYTMPGFLVSFSALAINSFICTSR